MLIRGQDRDGITSSTSVKLVPAEGGSGQECGGGDGVDAVGGADG